MDQWETLAEIVRLQRRQAAHLDRMSDQLDQLERLITDGKNNERWELAPADWCAASLCPATECHLCANGLHTSARGA